jgi:DNA excision repair protein ERCC-4
MMHLATSEEHKYLVGLRREKEAFERLIRERSVSAILE